MAWLQQQPTRERPDTFRQTARRQNDQEPCTDGADHTFFASSSFSAALSSIGVGQQLLQPGVLAPPAPSAAWPRRPPSRRTWPSSCRSVASLIPCLRHRSAVFTPASCSLRIAMICSSVNLLRFIVWSFLKAGLQFILDQFNGATSTGSLDPRSKFLKFIPGANGCRLPALGYVYDCINRLGSNPQLANACLPCCKVPRWQASNAPGPRSGRIQPLQLYRRWRAVLHVWPVLLT